MVNITLNITTGDLKNMDKQKTAGQQLEQSLLHKKQTSFKLIADKKDEAKSFADEYIRFMNLYRTEREIVLFSVSLLENSGFEKFDPKKSYKAGDKIYYENYSASLIAAVIGKKDIEEGLRIIASHIDSPRLDLKPNPLYEEGEIGYLKSHYYGGIKKYQWATIPLAMHGVFVKKSGEKVFVSIGEREEDPVFCVTDLLPHLSHKTQDKRTAREVLKGEELNIVFGTEPYDDENVKSPIKLAIMKLLNERYGIVERDFISAEIQFIPAIKTRYIGLDQSLIGGYGQDDRICAYTSLKAFLEVDKPEHTALIVFADKEETGSNGNTGLNSDFLKNFVSLLSKAQGGDVETVFHNTKALSSDVAAAFDPTFQEVYEKRNSSHLNHGPSLEKYTGSGGKNGTNEASAEYVAYIRDLLDKNDIPWQSGELGKLDEGGGGTVAKYISKLGAEVVDFGAPLLSMHSPFEISSVSDLYYIYKSYKVFYI